MACHLHDARETCILIMSGKPLITLDHVSLTYPGANTPAVTDISFSVSEGDLVAILGPSGCGKTTVLRVIAGFERPTYGQVVIAGKIVASANTWVEAEHRGVGMVFQDYALFPHLTVIQNVEFGLRGSTRDSRQEKIREVLTLVGLEGFEAHYPSALSGGQQQRVALARALAPQPSVLLLDEPFSSLDPDMTERMREELLEILERTGSTSILVTHDHEDALDMADNVAVLNAGQLEQFDTPDEIYHTPTTAFVADFVGQADFLPGKVTSGKVVTEVGTFENVGSFKDHTPVVVMIRPDDVSIRPCETAPAQVIRRHFRGSENLYRILLPSGQLLYSSESSTIIYPVGTKVEVHIEAIHTVVFSQNP